MRLDHKRAVVTGSSTGIGRAVAHAFAREGAAVVVNFARSTVAAEALVEEIQAQGGTAYAIQADIANATEVDALVSASRQALGEIDIWANIAGADILTGDAARAPDRDKLEQLIDVDLRGTMLCCWAVAPLMEAAGGGAILNMSWDLALAGMGGRNPEMFAAVKAGVTGFTRALSRSLAPSVRVNELAPGWIATAFAEGEMTPDYRQWVLQQVPMQRFGTPEDVAQAAVYLCADDSAYITGQTLKINGGLSS